MTSDRWQRVYELFNELRQLPPGERQTLLEIRCPDDPGLRDVVARLLLQDENAEREDFLAPPGTTADATPGAIRRPRGSIHLSCPNCRNPLELLDLETATEVRCRSCGSTFLIDRSVALPWSHQVGELKANRFELLEAVGSGAFGTVYRARDARMDRLVALKVLRAGRLASDNVRARFLEDARSAAQLQHAAIVPVHDVGEYDGYSYIVRDYIEGDTLAVWLKQHAPTFHESARLTAELADALEYAHSRGVIHRDVKSQNIMIDSDGRPHLMDFGLAKREASEITLTLDGQVLGTPAYMSPEQARGDVRRIDRRSDVYSLGVVLYEMLTHELPFRGSATMLLDQVLHDEPRPPRKLNERIPRDLETVCLKAMSKEPRRRYETARALGDDLRRFLRHEPVLARPIGPLRRAWRWCGRNPRLAAALGVTVLSLAATSASSSLYALKSGQLLTASDRHLALADFELGRAACERGDVGPGLHWLQRALGAATRADDSVLAHLAGANLAAWQRELPPLEALFAHGAEVMSATISPNGRTVVTAGADRVARIWDASTGAPIGMPLEHRGAVWTCAFSPDGATILTTSLSGEVKLWDTATGQLRLNLQGHAAAVDSSLFSPDGRYVLTGSKDRTARLWDVASGRELVRFSGHLREVTAVAMAPDGRIIATGSNDRTARLWDAASGRLLGPPLPHDAQVWDLEFSPDGQTLLTASWDHAARLWSVPGGQLVRTLPHRGAEVYTAIFSPDGQTIATACGDHEVRLWNAATGRLRGEPLRHDDRAWNLEFSPDGTRLLTASWDHTARLWNPADGRPIGPPFRHEGRVVQGSFRSDGMAVLTAGTDRTARLWKIEPQHRGGLTLPRAGAVTAAALSPDGRKALLGTKDGEVLACEAGTGRLLNGPVALGEEVTEVGWSPDGTVAAAGGLHGKARLWSLSSGQVEPLGEPLAFHDRVAVIAFSPDRQTVLLGSADTTAILCDTRTGKTRGNPLRHGGWVFAAAFSRDGSLAATACLNGSVRIWRSADGGHERDLPTHPGLLQSVAFSPDGTLLVTGSTDGQARFFDLEGARLPGDPLKHEGAVLDTVFSPDGKTLVTTSMDGQARIWDTASRVLRAQPLVHLGWVQHAAFSPDGRLVLTASADGTARLWDTATGRPVGPALEHPRNPGGKPFEVRNAWFHPDGDAVLTLCEDGTARFWTLPRGVVDPSKIAPWLERRTGLRLDEQGAVHVLDSDAWLRGRRLLKRIGASSETFPVR